MGTLETQQAAAHQWFGLSGKSAIVTGGTRGIGFGVAEALASVGAKVLICSRSQADIDKAVSTLQGKGLDVQGLAADLTAEADRAALLAKAKDSYGVLDILVLNAGTLAVSTIADFPLEKYHEIMKLNLESVFTLTQAAHPLLKASGSASIVMMSSTGGGPLANISCPAYAMSKAAMEQLTRYVAVEWAKDGITCNAVKPGFTVTEMTEAYVETPIGHKFLSSTPGGPQRRLGQVKDIAGLTLFLASPAARFITGQLIASDGGSSVFGVWGDDV